MAKVLKKINAKLYRKILEVLPISCVDLVIVSGKSFLMVKRKNKPAKGEWCVPGGRVFKNETLIQAVGRKVKEETGLKKFKIVKFLTVKEFFSKDSEFGPSTHTIDSVFIIQASLKDPLVTDNQSSDIRWFREVDKRWIKYARDILKLAGFK